MRRIDHVRKTVYIIVGILTIISLVFSLCKKVGLCASGGGSGVINSFPLPVGDGYGHNFTFTDEDAQNIINSVTDFDNSFPTIDYIAFYDYTPSNNDLMVACLYNPIFTEVATNSSNLLSLSGSTSNIWSGGSYVGYLYLHYNLTTHQVSGKAWRNSYFQIVTLSWFESVSGGFSLKLNENLYTYPIWIRSNSDYFANSNPIFSGHSKGGVLTNYIDSSDLIEQDSSLPSVDVTPPSDSTSIPSWLQKILSGIGKVNQSIKGGVLTIGDYIGQGFHNVIDWFTEPFDQEAFSDELNEIALIKRFSKPVNNIMKTLTYIVANS